MAVDLNKLSQPALKAALRGGTDEWGSRASIHEHVAYVEPLKSRSMRMRKCHCGCGKRMTHGLFANGIVMGGGCELSIYRRVKELSATPNT